MTDQHATHTRAATVKLPVPMRCPKCNQGIPLHHRGDGTLGYDCRCGFILDIAEAGNWREER